MPYALRIQFLRLASLSTRLQRLVHKSHQYLRLLDDRGRFEFHVQRIESFKEFIEQILSDSEISANIASDISDVSCDFDPYWMAVCLKNLLNNAQKYGQPPIRIEWIRHVNDLAISVEDQGPGPHEILTELIKPHLKGDGIDGMGLGLSLVHRLLQHMQGHLQLSLKPTRFTIHLGGVCRDQSAVS